jgi:glucose/arabinose dehydrogenase
MRNLSPILRGSILAAFVLVCLLAGAQTSIMVGNTEVNVTVKATGLNVPWDMVVGPDGWIWFTEIDGHVSRMNPDDGTIELIYTVPDVHETGLGGGLQSMAFHPDFANQPYVYLHYVNSTTTAVIKRYLYDAATHTFTTASDHLLSEVVHAGPSHNGSRIVVDDEGMFLISVGDVMSHSTDAPLLSTTYGKVLRFDPEGGIPADNPIPGNYVYNWGHRNPQGLIKASNGRIYNSAHGAGMDDEVNIVLPNRDYGWPTVLGLCNTATEIAYCDAHDVVDPIHEWSTEVVAPSGIDYYANPAIPEWENSILVATLRGKALHVLNLNASGDTVIASSNALYNAYGRFRDVLTYPDGRVFISTSNHDWAGSPSADDDRILELSAAISTGYSKNERTGPRLWPNPATGHVAVDVQGPLPQRVVLRDALGRSVSSTLLIGNTFDVSALAPGPYQVEIATKGKLLTTQLIIQAR